MKKLILATAFLLYTLTTFSQTTDKEWFASIGLNAINSAGKKSPINSPGDWANGLPISAAVELSWASGFAIEQSVTFNKFSEDGIIDGVILTEDYNYISFDTHAKYYFGKHIFPDLDWIDFYGNAGIGIFSIDETNISANLGGGVLFWFNRRKTIGVRVQTIAKFALDHKESGLDNNHFQTHLQLIFAL
ncbi:hypothetical protein [Winogradskyella sp. UBA3174]|uniref:hypothetical protein n=1 Tax=Winogradskyella sp. UBA3174 TaxID=1947785 RepID=UPI0025F68A4A|nr:hypothetical protein [Winogradskyella sp. UBA3174]|tara:strand:- start:37053 stop:37619 length:567 start_codon:yes stop_codon:yes gene_type:complete